MENSSKVKVVKIPEDMPKFEVEIHGCQCKIFQSGHDKIDWKSRVVNLKKKWISSTIEFFFLEKTLKIERF